MSKVEEISVNGFTPEVMANQIPWKDAERAMIIVHKKDGTFSFWASAMVPANMCLLKTKFDHFFNEIVKIDFKLK